MLPDVVWHPMDVPLEPGWALMLYTDGVFEGRVRGKADRLGTVTALLLVFFVVLSLGLHRRIVRPILTLADEVREATDDISHRIPAGQTPRELAELATDVEALRQRLVAEVALLSTSTGSSTWCGRSTTSSSRWSSCRRPECAVRTLRAAPKCSRPHRAGQESLPYGDRYGR